LILLLLLLLRLLLVILLLLLLLLLPPRPPSLPSPKQLVLPLTPLAPLVPSPLLYLTISGKQTVWLTNYSYLFQVLFHLVYTVSALDRRDVHWPIESRASLVFKSSSANELQYRISNSLIICKKIGHCLADCTHRALWQLYFVIYSLYIVSALRGEIVTFHNINNSGSFLHCNTGVYSCNLQQWHYFLTAVKCSMSVVNAYHH
jgi:hypothetical protein